MFILSIIFGVLCWGTGFVSASIIADAPELSSNILNFAFISAILSLLFGLIGWYRTVHKVCIYKKGKIEAVIDRKDNWTLNNDFFSIGKKNLP